LIQKSRITDSQHHESDEDAMANETTDADRATPPGRGEQNHEVMQAGAMRPVTGHASDDLLAASGGLEVPGREVHPMSIGSGAAPHEPIPGERDRDTLTRREVGALGSYNGAELTGDTPAWLDEDAIAELRHECGGVSRRRP
jgi:hypothetical protein